MIPRSSRGGGLQLVNSSSSIGNTPGGMKPPIPLPTDREVSEDQPPPPPKTRPPAMTPPPLPPSTSGPSVTDDNTTSSSSLHHHFQHQQQATTTIYSTVKHHHRSDHQQEQGLQKPTSQVRTYVRSPGNFLSSSNSNGHITPVADEESFLNSLSREDLIARIRIVESKNRKLILDNGQMMKDLNHHVNQLQGFKHQNFQLRADNHELRDLCCYLDDERNRARALAKEWQSFGTHMSRVMRHEVSTYAKKLQQLEEKQFDLVRENFELKQLCILLDNALHARPPGEVVGVGNVNNGALDGSTGSGSMASSNEQDSMTHATSNTTNSSNATVTGVVGRQVIGSSPGVIGMNRPVGQQQHQQPNLLNPQTLDYIRSLEQRIRQLEYEKRQLVSDMSSNTGTIDSTYTAQRRHLLLPPMSPTRELSSPPAVTEAMRVLRIREGHDEIRQLPPHAPSMSASALEAGTSSRIKKESHTEESATLFDQQKEQFRSFCRYAWGKLEGTGSRILSAGGRRTRSLSRAEARGRKKSL